ncbi:hypothetical protein LCGC14_0288960 [marine sediment metagenome]|uniref:Uncharacterized protein n=1 Tax=marine sediment metagenome TaxID=412755 RepID=A0A0F9TYQ4_9ZZZZ
MKATPPVCDFCARGRLVVKLPETRLLICSQCITDLRLQFTALRDGAEG